MKRTADLFVVHTNRRRLTPTMPATRNRRATRFGPTYSLASCKSPENARRPVLGQEQRITRRPRRWRPFQPGVETTVGDLENAA